MPVLHHELLLWSQLIEVLLTVDCGEVTVQTRFSSIPTKLGFSSLLNFKINRKEVIAKVLFEEDICVRVVNIVWITIHFLSTGWAMAPWPTLVRLVAVTGLK